MKKYLWILPLIVLVFLMLSWEPSETQGVPPIYVYTCVTETPMGVVLSGPTNTPPPVPTPNLTATPLPIQATVVCPYDVYLPDVENQ